MKKLISIIALSTLLSSSAFAMLLEFPTTGQIQDEYGSIGSTLFTTFSLPTVLVDDVAHVDLAADEVIAALVAGEEEAIVVYAQAFQTSEEEIMNAVENMEEISLEALQAEL